MRQFCLIFSFFLFISPEISSQAATPIPYQEAVISSADKFSTEAGIEILKKGGNADDAAIAVQFG